ncbi:MAG: hypothetical protein IPL29_08535 [Propionivibrio sp.]|nr:hypothetical protein [Propionivibrio sp.]
MHLVLVTSLLISGLLWRGTPYRLLQTIRQQPSLLLYSSTVLLEELADVLTRGFAIKRLGLINKSTREVRADFVEAVVNPNPRSKRDER